MQSIADRQEEAMESSETYIGSMVTSQRDSEHFMMESCLHTSIDIDGEGGRTAKLRIALISGQPINQLHPTL